MLWGHTVTLYWRPSKEKDGPYSLLITNTPNKRVWWVYGHHKQMVENYHDDLKNKLGIRKLPSHKFYAILVYFCIVLLVYMLARAVLLGVGMNKVSCGTVLFVASLSPSKESLIKNLFLLGKRKPGWKKSEKVVFLVPSYTQICLVYDRILLWMHTAFIVESGLCNYVFLL